MLCFNYDLDGDFWVIIIILVFCYFGRGGGSGAGFVFGSVFRYVWNSLLNRVRCLVLDVYEVEEKL